MHAVNNNHLKFTHAISTGLQAYPNGISVDSKGNVLVADDCNKRVQVFDASGHYLSSITHTTPGEKLQGPISVAVGPNDLVYVVEYIHP